MIDVFLFSSRTKCIYLIDFLKLPCKFRAVYRLCLHNLKSKKKKKKVLKMTCIHFNFAFRFVFWEKKKQHGVKSFVISFVQEGA